MCPLALRASSDRNSELCDHQAMAVSSSALVVQALPASTADTAKCGRTGVTRPSSMTQSRQPPASTMKTSRLSEEAMALSTTVTVIAAACPHLAATASLVASLATSRSSAPIRTPRRCRVRTIWTATTAMRRVISLVTARKLKWLAETVSWLTIIVRPTRGCATTTMTVATHAPATRLPCRSPPLLSTPGVNRNPRAPCKTSKLSSTSSTRSSNHSNKEHSYRAASRWRTGTKATEATLAGSEETTLWSSRSLALRTG